LRPTGKKEKEKKSQKKNRDKKKKKKKKKTTKKKKKNTPPKPTQHHPKTHTVRARRKVYLRGAFGGENPCAGSSSKERTVA